MALQAKCGECKIRWVWGTVGEFGGISIGKQIPLRDANCRACGSPLQATTHLSKLRVRRAKPWTRAKAVSEVGIKKALGG